MKTVQLFLNNRFAVVRASCTEPPSIYLPNSTKADVI